MKLKEKNGPTFSERVIRITRSIPVGRVTTYGRISQAAGGGAMASQSITTILGRAYTNGVTDIPFHRIVYANGKIWRDETYYAKRLKLYKQEGIALDQNDKIIDFEEKLFEFK